MKSNSYATMSGKVPTDITGTLTPGSGSTISLVRTDFANGYPNFKSGSSESGKFSIGAAVISSCNLLLVNDTGKFDSVVWEDAKFNISITQGGVTVAMGTFYVVDHQESGRMISVTAYDCMKKLDERYLSDDGVTWPSTISAVVSAIATGSGLTITGYSSYGSVALPDPGNSKMTERAALAYIAQICGCYVVAKSNAADSIEFKTYSVSSPYSAGNCFSHNLWTSSYSVTGIVVYTSDDTDMVSKGGAATLIIQDNPFIDADNINGIANTIWANLQGITYYPGTAYIPANAAIDAGDALSVTTALGSKTILATKVSYKPSIQQTITADAKADAKDLRLPASKQSQAADQTAQQALTAAQTAQSTAQQAAQDAADALEMAEGAAQTIRIATFSTRFLKLNAARTGYERYYDANMDPPWLFAIPMKYTLGDFSNLAPAMADYTHVGLTDIYNISHYRLVYCYELQVPAQDIPAPSRTQINKPFWIRLACSAYLPRYDDEDWTWHFGSIIPYTRDFHWTSVYIDLSASWIEDDDVIKLSISNGGHTEGSAVVAGADQVVNLPRYVTAYHGRLPLIATDSTNYLVFVEDENGLWVLEEEEENA